MTKKPWTSPDQRVWLEKLIPAFVESQENKTTGTSFLPETFKEWDKKWPVGPPTEAELEKVDGDQEKALAKKTKAMESVRYPNGKILHNESLLS
jgi:hypothetical protein